MRSSREMIATAREHTEADRPDVEEERRHDELRRDASLWQLPMLDEVLRREVEDEHHERRRADHADDRAKDWSARHERKPRSRIERRARHLLRLRARELGV